MREGGPKRKCYNRHNRLVRQVRPVGRSDCRSGTEREEESDSDARNPRETAAKRFSSTRHHIDQWMNLNRPYRPFWKTRLSY
jgi:hypothetical protein